MNRILILLLPCFIIGTAAAKENNLKKTSDELNSDETCGQYVFDPSQDNQIKKQKRSIFIQLNASALFASMSDWKNQLYLSDGTHPSSISMVFGGEIGCVINSYFEIGAGYELFFTPSANAVAPSPNLNDQVTGNFFYGSLRAGSFLESIPELYLFGGADVGTLSATESLQNYYGFNFERTGKTMAYRLKTGAQYYTSDNWSVTVEAGYLLGKVTNVSAQPISNYALNFSGIELRFAVNYHIPL